MVEPDIITLETDSTTSSVTSASTRGRLRRFKPVDKRTTGEKIFDTVNILFMIFIILVMLLPFIFVLNGSLVSDKEFILKGGVILFPENIDFANYSFLFKGDQLLPALIVSVLRVAIGVPLSLVCIIILAYAISKRKMPGHKGLMVFLVVMMYFDGGIIPFLIMVRDLKMYDTFLMYILPFLISPWYAIILRNFIDTIPESLEESARMDGAGELTILTRIIVPLAVPGIATIGLFSAVLHWNDWFTGFAYMSSRSPIPLQTFLRRMMMISRYDLNNMAQIVNMNPPLSESLKMAAIVITTIPIICVYPFVQKYFVKGLLIGSVKG